MPSASLHHWRTVRCIALDEIVSAHKSIGGGGPGRRYATEQINHAYAVLLSAQFQGFCRDLHFECTRHLVQGIGPPALQSICRDSLVRARNLDRGNPNPGNIGSDFKTLGLEFWVEVRSLDSRNASRQAYLEGLNSWRNAIAHQDYSKLSGGSKLQFKQVRAWRAACNQLAVAFDEVLCQHVLKITGNQPW